MPLRRERAFETKTTRLTLFVVAFVLVSRISTPKSLLRISDFNQAVLEGPEELEESLNSADLESVKAIISRQKWRPYAVTLPAGFSGYSIILKTNHEESITILIFTNQYETNLFAATKDNTFVSKPSANDAHALNSIIRIETL